ncbi:E3 ubiquitin-protein ligase Topors-like isoform X2 [Ornithodoros turicata]
MSTECSAGDSVVCDNMSVKKDTEGDMNAKLNQEETPERPPSRDTASPENSCAICLSSPENKSFTDSCFHTFCFSCLLEWSKVKAECPLCKQRFKSIVHNVRSFEDYDRYFVNNVVNNVNMAPVTWGPDGYHTRTLQRFRFPTTLTRERRQQQAMERRLEALNWGASRRSRSITVATRGSPLPTTSIERRNLYDLNLWVRPSTIRYREASPEFYRTNPACTHRLIPWLNRELVALLDRNEGQVAFVMELILALIVRYDVRSAEFLEHVLPFFQNRTGHFIHEFYCFATSPYDMVAYDRTAVYESMEEALARGFITSSLTSLDERGREESVPAEPAPPVDPSQPGPSGLSMNATVDVESDSDNSDCVLVNVVKPTRERTPVVISLVSSSDDEAPNASAPPPAAVPPQERRRKKRSEKSEKKSKAAHKSLPKPSVASRLKYVCSDSDTSSDEGGGGGGRRRTLTVTREGDVKLRIRSFVGSFSAGGSGDASGEDSSSRDRQRSHRSHHKKSKKHKHRHRRSSSE